ncbi:hypothetical protein UCRPA7_7131 [Phaeoacremonium minimum UCRPA7]|uniref:SMODS and SLOG-associating 2TM effector domain-containing protein n=1 Tax=Phaeoacremonium minimum (strain UCR-PA7) TaxID=1286976 RepID=R8BDK5_PHAM7|nr:hypothetical protein UCRPA7_7131 [Phaeoacremonium minimum UCRPA7]EON97375.1 hypothetical protein UCRPA7_7131 [Phaeoacremonium minimum UCRPA7]
MPEDDPLALFRLMLGITASPQLGFSASGPTGTRPAANIGLYARVVDSEQKAKDSYKVFSVVINGCYFLQIIIAAALTALGAANANNKAITAFGALNTVIAGFLTFLKGSGLPGRLKYFGNEWKKIREFIEQRERDFSRHNCPLDVHEVVATIEQMYANTKQEIEMNTPDSYNSVTSMRLMGGGGSDKIGGIDASKIDGVMNKLKNLDGTIGNLKSQFENKTHQVHETAHHLQDDEKHVEEEIRYRRKALVSEIEEEKPRLTREVSYAMDEAARQVRNEIMERGTHAVTDARDMQERAWDDARTGIARQVRITADEIDEPKKQGDLREH